MKTKKFIDYILGLFFMAHGISFTWLALTGLSWRDGICAAMFFFCVWLFCGEYTEPAKKELQTKKG